MTTDEVKALYKQNLLAYGVKTAPADKEAVAYQIGMWSAALANVPAPAAQAALMRAFTVCRLRRYRQDPEFQAEYRKRCTEMLEEATNKAKSALPPAVERLSTIAMDDAQQPQQQIAAARAVLEYGLRLIEANDFEQRLQALEERSAGQ